MTVEKKRPAPRKTAAPRLDRVAKATAVADAIDPERGKRHQRIVQTRLRQARGQVQRSLDQAKENLAHHRGAAAGFEGQIADLTDELAALDEAIEGRA